ncbi:MAG: Na/Pi symporter [Myxococcota bacterium]|jgi:sodium-dependent phosphate cotransporter|nr:Na/Pi symporter [Myxococcota bacterium]
MSSPKAQPRTIPTWQRLILLFLLLFLFLVAIKLMSGAIKMMGAGAVGDGGMLAGIQNPFAGLAVGILATVLVQSSSTTTAVIVSTVGSGVLPLGLAVPMIMGANIGTTITNTLVSIGHVQRSEQFRRAFAAATVHDFFNILCVIVFLPLEIATGLLSKSAIFLSSKLSSVGGVEYKSPLKVAVKTCGKAVKHVLESIGLHDTPLAIAILLLGIALTFFCLIHITRNMRHVIAGRLETTMNNALEQNSFVGIFVGIVVTVMVQSSSVTTSLLVPMCAAGILPLLNAFPIMLGANLGTTVTALLASMAVDNPAGLTIALVHVIFNIAGILLFYPLMPLRRIPITMANMLASAAVRNRLWVIVYVAIMFVILPLLGWKMLG